MAKFYVLDVMERKVDGVLAGYNIVIICEGDSKVTVVDSVFVPSKAIITSKASISQVAETWLKEKDGILTRAETMAQKAVNISDQQVIELIPKEELNIVVKPIEPVK